MGLFEENTSWEGKNYSEVAKAIGKPLAVRAVANAIGKNPLCSSKFLAIE